MIGEHADAGDYALGGVTLKRQGGSGRGSRDDRFGGTRPCEHVRAWSGYRQNALYLRRPRNGRHIGRALQVMLGSK